MSSTGLSFPPAIHIIGSSVIGPLHVHMGLPCQDACAYRCLPSGAAIIAVADGLGSATRSDVGAQLAVNVALETALSSLQHDDSADISLSEIAAAAVSHARGALADRASADGCAVRDLACTIIVVAIRKDEMAVAHIGDGAVVAQTENGLQLVSGPGESEYANEVVPLTSDGWQKSLRLVHLRNRIRAIAVFTDGCQRAAFRKSAAGLEPFAGFFNPIFEYVSDSPNSAEAEQEVSALLTSRKLCANCEDDKTLIVAVINRN